MAAKPKKEKESVDKKEVEGPKKPEVQVFKMIRNDDESGISGTGVVVEGTVFSDGTVVVRWLGATPCKAHWDSFEAFAKIHIESHPDNNTEIVWYTIRKRS